MPATDTIVAVQLCSPGATPLNVAVNDPVPGVDPERDPAPVQEIVTCAEGASVTTDAVAVIVAADPDPYNDPDT